jgi:hypothetical protein
MLHRTGGYPLFGSLKRDYVTSGFLCLLFVGVTTPCLGLGEFYLTVIVQGTKVPRVGNVNRYR